MVELIKLGLKENKRVKKVFHNKVEIEVTQYLPEVDKEVIIEMAMNQADQGTIMNTLALEARFRLYIVLKYSNLSVPGEMKQDPSGLYDLFEGNGLVDLIIGAIPEKEYNSLLKGLLESQKAYAVYRNSVGGIINSLGAFLPADFEQKIKNISQEDIGKMSQVLNLAQATGQRN